jgi:hypothetical protein
MDKNAATALVAIGGANLALGERWLEISAWALESAHRMNRAAFETFCEGTVLRRTGGDGERRFRGSA